MGHAPFFLIPLPYASGFIVRIFCHPCITCCITAWLFIPLFLFSIFLFGCIRTVHTSYVHWNMTYCTCCPDIRHLNKYTPVYTTYDWNSNIFTTGLISCGWYSEVYSSHFILLLHDRPLMSTPFTAFILCTSVHIACVAIATLVTWFHVYETYTSGIFTHILYIIWYTPLHKRYIVYTTCIHLVSFSKTVYTTIVHLSFLKRKYFSYCPSRLRMLTCG